MKGDISTLSGALLLPVKSGVKKILKPCMQKISIIKIASNEEVPGTYGTRNFQFQCFYLHSSLSCHMMHHF